MDLHKLVEGNQTIKIVPSIEDTLRSTGLNVELDIDTVQWFNQIKNTWKTWKKSATVERSIECFLQSRPDPHRVALALIIKCEDFKDCKPKTLPFCIIETLQKWAEKNAVMPEDSLKLPAFWISTKQRNQHFFTLIVQTYHMSTISELIVPIVKGIIEEGNYKQACQIVIAMELFDTISVEELLFPLILQEKTNLIDDYLSESPNQVKPFLLFMDKLLDKHFNIREYVAQYIETHNVNYVKYDKLHYKPLGKLVARLCNKFKIPIETCKNLSKNRTTGGLKYLIYQKYQEHKVTSVVWDDLVKDSLKQNIDSAVEFIDLLCDYDRKEALRWAEYLNMPESAYPPGLKDVSTTSSTETENWDMDRNESQDFYRMAISTDHIILIDTAEKFYDMMSSDLIKFKIVSIDCEWKPSFGATQSRVALIQIATYDTVYLIDTIVLNSKQFSSFWYTFNKSLLDNPEIIKLGFGLEQDLKEVKASIIGLNNIKVKGEGLLDIALLWKSLLSSGLLASSPEATGNSLSSLVQLCFGVPLAKSEQCSNWELRPLRSTQIEYAALDAHILIEIYYYLEKLCSKQGINFEEICNDIMLEGKPKNSKLKTKVTDRIQSSCSTRSVTQIKFLVDPKLSKLLSYLRYCGIDSKVAPPCMLWHDIVNLAISEDRCILLPKIKFSPTNNYPQSSILEVGAPSSNEQLEKIISHFNINVSKTNILKRCIYCNSDVLTPLTPSEIQSLYSKLAANIVNQSAITNSHDQYDHDINYDNFLSDSDSDGELYQPDTQRQVTKITTSRGVSIQSEDLELLTSLKKSAFLCEACGRILWDGEKVQKQACELVNSIKKLSLG